MKSIRETQTKKKKAEESKELDFLETNADFGIESKRDRKRLRKWLRDDFEFRILIQTDREWKNTNSTSILDLFDLW